MRKYLSNVLIYLAALCGIIAFVGLFSSPLQIYNELNGTWSVYNVKAYLGEVNDGVTVYRGTIGPIFGFILPLIMAVFLILESFRPKLSSRLTAINTMFAVLFFLSAVVVLLTKELYLRVNELGDSVDIRNGTGPILSACCSSLAGILLLIVCWVPGIKSIDFIKKQEE